MSMLTLNGKVANVFESPKSVNRETGEVQGGKSRVQIMAQNVLQNGETRLELVNLTVESIESYKKLLGRFVRVPVGAFVSSGAVMYYALKGQVAQTDATT